MFSLEGSLISMVAQTLVCDQEERQIQLVSKGPTISELTRLIRQISCTVGGLQEPTARGIQLEPEGGAWAVDFYVSSTSFSS